MSIGYTLKEIRVGKGLSSKQVHGDWLSQSQLSRIESGDQLPSVDKFFKILSAMNVKMEEFCLLEKENELGIRTNLDRKIIEALRQRNLKKVTELLGDVKKNYDHFGSDYFKHMEVLLKTTLTLIQNNYSYNTVVEQTKKSDIQMIRDYLLSVKKWHYYEVRLLNNLNFIFDLEEVFELGEKAIKAIERDYLYYKDQDAICGLLNNLAIRALSSPQHYFRAFSYSMKAIGLPRSSRLLMGRSLAKIVNQIANFKLDNGLFDLNHLKELLNWFIISDLKQNYDEILQLIIRNGIVLDE